MNSNEKAKLTASLNLCLIKTGKSGKVVGGVCPAQLGQMAHVKYDRTTTGIRVVVCTHYDFDGNNRVCEGFYGGHVCYHAKAILIQAAEANGYDLTFSANATEGSLPIFAHPSRIIFMQPVTRVAEPVVEPVAPTKVIKTKKKKSKLTVKKT